MLEHLRGRALDGLIALAVELERAADRRRFDDARAGTARRN